MKKTLHLFAILILGSLLFQNVVNAQPVIDSTWINEDTIPIYGKFEISLIINTGVSNVYDYEKFSLQAFFESPSGEKDTIDGFYFQDYIMVEPNVLVPDGDPFWKIRFTPFATGLWKYDLKCTDTTGTVTVQTADFVCVSSEQISWLSFEENYLMDMNDQYVFLVGENLAWGNDEGSFYEYEEWIENLDVNGANYVKIIMAPWSFGLEWLNTGTGNYQNRSDRAFAFDWIIEKIVEKQFYFTLAPLIHDELNLESSEIHNWYNNPYNIINGGPCVEPDEFFSNTAAVDLFKRKLRYINARWGYLPNMVAWEIFTEVDSYENFTEDKQEIRGWINDMALYIRTQLDRFHLISPSYAISQNDSIIWNNSEIDFTQLHLYHPDQGDMELEIFARTRDYITSFNKPVIVGEFALALMDELLELDPEGIAFHNTLWTSVLSGAFSTAMTWWWNNYIDPQNLYHNLKPLSAFIKETEFSMFDKLPESVHSVSDSNLNVTVVPRFFSLLEKSDVDTFYVERNGYFSPGKTYLGEVLYGTDPFGQSLRNPPTFHVNYTQPGEFVVTTGEIVVNSVMRVKLDGEVIFEEAVSANSTYNFEITTGEHYLFVENTGNTFGSAIEIDEYSFDNYAPVLRSFALSGESNAIGWYQNRLYNWEYFLEHQEEPPPVNGKLSFHRFGAGNYHVEWFNCTTGVVDSTTLVTVSQGDILELDIAALQWDGSFKIKLIVGVSDQQITANQTPIVYPNPFSTSVTILVPDEFGDSGSVCIYDLTGRKIIEINLGDDDEGSRIFTWNGMDNSGVEVNPGLYLVRLQSMTSKNTLKLLKM